MELNNSYSYILQSLQLQHNHSFICVKICVYLHEFIDHGMVIIAYKTLLKTDELVPNKSILKYAVYKNKLKLIFKKK